MDHTVDVDTSRRSGEGQRGAQAPPVAPRRPRDTRIVLAVVLVLGALAAYELLRAARMSAQLANEDTSLLWVAARDWASGHIRQPNFYGQSYGSTFESIPIVLVHAMHVSYWTSTALVLATIEWVAWAFLAWAAWRRGHRLIGALAFAMPVVLSAYHAVYVTMVPDAPAPRLLVVVGCALLIMMPTSDRLCALAIALIAFGVQFDGSSLLLCAPVLAWYGITYLRTARQVRALSLGAVAPIVVFAYTRFFYWRHPDYAFHESPGLRASAKTLFAARDHLGDFFRLYSPELVRSWLIPVVAFAVLIGLAVWSRRVAYVIPAALAGLVVVYAIATPKAETELGPLLPRGRVLLAVPFTIWFLCFLVAESGVLSRFRPRLTGVQVLSLLCVVCFASTALRIVDSGPREDYWLRKAVAFRSAAGLKYGYALRRPTVDQCNADASFARRNHVSLIVYGDRLRTYACAAELGVQTVTPGYERRTWVLYEESRRPRTSLLLTDVSEHVCELVRQRASCAWEAGYATLRFPAQPALPLLASIAVPVRGFGPHCHPRLVFSAVVCNAGTGMDLRRRPFAPSPTDPVFARAEITRAFVGMFGRGPDDTTFTAVEEGSAFPDVARSLDIDPGLPLTPRVVDITFLDDHEAVVDYRVGGKAATGEAVIQDGSWRVAALTFCDALAEKFTARARLIERQGCSLSRFF